MFLSRLLIISLVLIFPSFSFAEKNPDLKVMNGRLSYPVGDFNENGFRPWKQIGGGIVQEYSSAFDKNPRVVYNGMRSVSTVPVTITQTVPRQTVLKNLLGKAIAGGRIAAGAGSGPIGWAITGSTVAKTAYDLVAPTLHENGYVWDSNAQNFVTTKEYIIEITGNDNRKDSEGNKLVLYRLGLTKRSYDYGYESYKSTLDALCDKATKDVSDYEESVGRGSHKAIEYKGSSFSGGCSSVTAWGSAIKAFWTIKPNTKQPITQSEFDDIIGPRADTNPTPYVNSTANDDGTIPGVTTSPDVTVPNGTIVTIGPYTDKDGQPKQVTVKFTTQNGETTVTVTVTSRPDLTPNSPSAPSSSPGSSSSPGNSSNQGSSYNPGTSPNPDGSSETGGGARTETIPGQKNKDDSSENPDNSDEKTDDKLKEQQDGGLLCNLFPDILACAKMGEVQEDEPFKIPHITDEKTFSPDFFLPDTAQCPAPEVVSIMGQQYEFSYYWLCRFSEMIRFLVIGLASISAAYIMFSGLRKD